MKAKLIILGLIVILGGSRFVFAGEGHGDKGSMMEENGSMMGQEGMMDHKMDEKGTKAIEVGNKICPVSGDKIPAPGEESAMGEVVKYEYNGKIYNLCCEMCIKDFKKNPEKYSKIAEDEVKTKGEGEMSGEEKMGHDHKGSHDNHSGHDHSK